MASRYVRLYEGPEHSNVLGFSASAAPEEKDNFEDFMENMGYRTEKFEWGSERHAAVISNLGGVSSAYYGIQPPLRDDDKFALARWCAEHIYTGHNSGYLIDNRMTPTPLKPFHNRDQEIIASW